MKKPILYLEKYHLGSRIYYKEISIWTLISVSLAAIINFYSPEIRETQKGIKTKNKIITGFPNQYFEGEVLTEEMIEFRIRLIYISFMIYITVIFSVSPIVGQATFISPTTSIERLIPNQLDSQTKQQKLLLDLRGGSDLFEFIIRILLIWTLSKNAKPTEGFQPTRINPINHQHFEHPTPRIAPKL